MKRARFRFTARNRGMRKSRCRSADRTESVVMNSEEREPQRIGDARMPRVRPRFYFRRVVLPSWDCARGDIILYYDVYCNNKYYISTFYKSHVFFYITAVCYVVIFIAHVYIYHHTPPYTRIHTIFVFFHLQITETLFSFWSIHIHL